MKLLKFVGPFVVVSCRKLNLLLQLLFSFRDCAVQVAATDTEFDGNVSSVVFSINKGCAGLFDEFRLVDARPPLIARFQVDEEFAIEVLVGSVPSSGLPIWLTRSVSSGYFLNVSRI